MTPRPNVKIEISLKAYEELEEVLSAEFGILRSMREFKDSLVLAWPVGDCLIIFVPKTK